MNAECRDASKNTLRTVGGLAHKKLGSYLCLAPYSHHTNWQTALKYTQLFDLIPEILGYTIPTLYPADAPLSQLSKKRIISDHCYVRLEKIAAACDEAARN